MRYRVDVGEWTKLIEIKNIPKPIVIHFHIKILWHLAITVIYWDQKELVWPYLTNMRPVFKRPKYLVWKNSCKNLYPTTFHFNFFNNLKTHFIYQFTRLFDLLYQERPIPYSSTQKWPSCILQSASQESRNGSGIDWWMADKIAMEGLGRSFTYFI